MRSMRFAFAVVVTAIMALGAVRGSAQTATYHLHKETSAINSSFDKLLTAGPDASTTAFTTTLTSKTAGEYKIKEFETQSGVPNAGGLIPSGSTLNFSVWMRKTANVGTVFPRAKLQLNSASGTLLCTATGSTALTTTITKQSFTCTISSNVTMATTDRFYLWVGVNLTATSSSSFNGELDIEGAANGNFDSQITLPLPSPAPTIGSLSPNSGPVASSVVISGSNFGSSQGTVAFNGLNAAISNWSSTSITAVVPANATTGPVVVTVAGQSSAGVTFTVTPPPSISSISTSSGRYGASVTISGSNFGTSQGNGFVRFNGVSAAITSWAAGSIVTTVPGGATSGDIVVTIAGGVASNGVNFTVIPPPGISSLQPNTGAPGTAISIKGANFGPIQGTGSVTFNGAPAAVASWSDTAITATVPAGSTSGNVVITLDGGAASTSGAPFAVINSTGVTVDRIVSGQDSSASGTIVSDPLTTNAAPELLLAFVTGGGNGSTVPAVTSITGGDLTWALVGRSNVQGGTAEIWRAFATTLLVNTNITVTMNANLGQSTLTVVSFLGVDPSGANGAGAIGAFATANGASGAPTVSLTTTRNNSLVFGVGSDSSFLGNNSFSTHTAGSNQTVISQAQYLGCADGNNCNSSFSSSLWVQQLDTAVAAAATNVQVNDVAPTADPYDLAAVEILPASVPGSGPILTSLSSYLGSAGTPITITGVNLGASQGASAVTFNGLTATPVSWNATSIVVPVPAGTSTGNVVVTVGGQSSNGLKLLVANSSGLAVDQVLSADGEPFAPPGTGSFSTSTGNELLLALVSSEANSPDTATISGAGLTWTLVQRTNTQAGTAEIWSAFSPYFLSKTTISASFAQLSNGSLTVVSLVGVDTSGTDGSAAIGAIGTASSAAGAPSGSITTTRGNSLVFAAGNDPVGAIARTPGDQQTILHQVVSPCSPPPGLGVCLVPSNTLWTQQITNSIATSGTNATINDTAPTGDAYNLSIVEVRPPANVSPSITSLSPAAGPVGTVVTINGSNFGGTQGASTVSFGGVNVTPTSWTSTAVGVIVPAGLPLGPASVIVTVPNAGTSNSATFTVVAPLAIAASAAPAANAAGWNNTNVTVSYQCTGGVAPVQCPPSQTITTEGASQVVSATATDAIGESATASVTLKIDKTAPTLAITSPANNSTVTTSSLPVSGTVADSLSGVAAVTCNGAAATVQSGTFSCTVTLTNGSNTITVQATDVAGNSSTQTITVSFGTPSIADFNPKSGPAGTLVTITGTNLVLGSGGATVTLNQQGSGTISAPITTASPTSISFVIPPGAATGPITVTTANQSATSLAILTVTARSSFGMNVGPATANVIQGQSAAYSISLNSADGFSQLAALSVSGLPAGVTASFNPTQITNGQISILTVNAPAGQAIATSTLTISAAATVDGISSTQTTTVSLSVQPVTTSFFGRILESDTIETPIPGIRITFLGKDDANNPTGCSGTTSSDAAGNFLFSNLPAACVGRQLVWYNGQTSTDGELYAGVNLAYTIIQGQPTGPEQVHLPRIDNAETVQVHQNWPTDQVFNFTTIPGITVTVYANTTFTLPDGTTPDPFPFTGVQVPVDRLPDAPVDGTGTLRAFIVAFQPDNTVATQPVSVVWPNSTNTPPGVNMELDTLDSVVGNLIKYGTGTVSGDGATVIPDLDPAHPGHRYGIEHFDWHGPLAPAKNGIDPSTDPHGPKPGDPVDAATGLLTINKTDLAFGGARGQVVISRTYRTLSGTPGPFGVGTNFNYGYQLNTFSFIQNQGFVTLIMPDGNQLQFTQQAGGTLVNNSVPSLAGAVITNPSSGVYNLRWKNGTVFKFQSPPTGGRVAYINSITDTNNNVTTMVRGNTADPSQITQITDPVGRSLALAYDTFDRITSIVDPIGRTVSYTYNSQGTLATVTDPASGITRYAYDGNNRITDITDPRGILFLHNDYDGNGKVVKQTAADGGVTTFAYTLLNANSNVTFSQGTGGGGGGGGVLNLGGSTINTSPVLLTTVTDPLGNQTTYHFNPQGYLIDMTDALGEKTVYERDPGTNQVLSITDSLNRTTTFTYDANGNTLSTARLAGTPNAVTTSATFDPVFNKLTSVTDALGHTTSMTYDPAGNPLSVASQNHQIAFTYDASGELLTTSDILGDKVQFAYTSGSVSSITDPAGNVTTQTSDAVGRLLSTTTPLGQTSLYSYTPLDQVTQATDALGRTTNFSFDPDGNLLSLTDPLGHTTSYTYDSMDRVETRIDPLNRQESYSRDFNSNLLTHTDRKHQVTSFIYDPLNRPELVGFNTVVNGGVSSYESTIAYTYDAGSRLTRVVDSAGGIITHSYDSFDRLLSETTPQGLTTYSYDNLGRQTAMQVAGQPPVSYSYDAANRMTQIAHGTSNVSFSYDDANRRSNLTMSNGTNISYTYDRNSRVTGITYKFNANLLGNLTYTYDAAGRRTQIGGSFARTGLPGPITSATYDAGNQLSNWNSTPFSHDANGNMLSDGINAFIWNARNQIASVNSTSMQYDAFGRRSRNRQNTSFVFDGVNVVQELFGSMVSANLFNGGIDEIFARTDSLGAFTPLKDALGSTIALVDSTGSISTTYSYDPFGNTIVSGASNSNVFQYTGRENEGNGLYFYRARYYSPVLGRFISEDPKGFSAGANFYRYADGNPISYSDPSGLDTDTCKGIVIPEYRPTGKGGGFGIIAGGSAGAGNGTPFDVGGTASVGHGLFWGGGNPLHYGTFATAGGFAGGRNQGPAYPGYPSGMTNGTMGGYMGLGAGLFATNANSSDSLGGPFDTTIVNFYFGEYQYATSGDIWQHSVTFGPGYGAGITYLSTNTWPGHSCLKGEEPEPWDQTDPGNYGVQ
jgi:RHS repeat-associated protein